jgi:hypothetical protein
LSGCHLDLLSWNVAKEVGSKEPTTPCFLALGRQGESGLPKVRTCSPSFAKSYSNPASSPWLRMTTDAGM